MANGNVTLLTDGKSRNTGRSFAHNDNRIAYTSTRRTGQDTDIWIMDPTDPKSDKMLLQLEGGGWGVADWSPDNKNLLVVQEVSANQTLSLAGGRGHGREETADAQSAAKKLPTAAARSAKTARASTPLQTANLNSSAWLILIWPP